MRPTEKFSRRPLVVVLVAICALAFAVAGCGGDDSGESASRSTDTTTEAAADTGDGGVTISDFMFDPDQVSVAAGTTVVWTNDDSADHTATADDDSFDTGVFGKGKQGEATLDEPGTYAYHCDLHPFMKGEIVVE